MNCERLMKKLPLIYLTPLKAIKIWKKVKCLFHKGVFKIFFEFKKYFENVVYKGPINIFKIYTNRENENKSFSHFIFYL